MNNSRSVFVSAGGDPFILLLAHKLFWERWYNEVDEFFVSYNNHCGVPHEIVAEVLKRLSKDPKVSIIYHPTGVGNGTPITEMTRVSKRDTVMLLEDDGFIFAPGIVDDCFKKIESGEYDAVGSPRFSCGPELGEASRIKYGLDYTGYGDMGPNYWPNFFFCKRNDLLRTDMDFASHKFSKDEYYPQLDWTFKEDTMGDTFVWACVQLRGLGLRFYSIPQHKADPYEIESKNRNEQNWHPSMQPFGWIHGGSLSTSWGGYLSGASPATDDSSIQEMESRCAFWKLSSDVIEGFEPFKTEYKKEIENLITRAHLDTERINKKYNIYKELLGV